MDFALDCVQKLTAPSVALTGFSSQLAQYTRNLIICVTFCHARNQLNVFYRCLMGDSTRQRLGHFEFRIEFRMTTTLPVNDKMKLLPFIIQVNDNLFDQESSDFLL